MTPTYYAAPEHAKEFADVVYVRIPQELKYVLKNCQNGAGIIGLQLHLKGQESGLAILLEKTKKEVSDELPDLS